ncbi:hypothetical protein P7K49_036938 [Saguinus oedipus]|uniref:Uncharacterized protein n=1 Tax=Saguinus oedipus TaxID=9490 RepID=A0ABQ9TLK0_SAGOE|nr:hypothetical protein P7K49_036938 [Saguinus oedipus]
MEDLGTWRTWAPGGPTHVENLGIWRTWASGGPGHLEDLGTWRTYTRGEPGHLEDLGIWRTWAPGGPGHLEDPHTRRTWAPGGPGYLENLGIWKTNTPGGPGHLVPHLHDWPFLPAHPPSGPGLNPSQRNLHARHLASSPREMQILTLKGACCACPTFSLSQKRLHSRLLCICSHTKQALH